jgi:hypothetical protein
MRSEWWPNARSGAVIERTSAQCRRLAVRSDDLRVGDPGRHGGQGSAFGVNAGRLRSKRGTPSVHPIWATSCVYADFCVSSRLASMYSVRERSGPMTAKSFHTLIARLGRRVGIHPHMAPQWLRIRSGQRRPRYQGHSGWMGHKNIQHTVRYTELAPDRFKDLWRN